MLVLIGTIQTALLWGKPVPRYSKEHSGIASYLDLVVQ